MMPGPISLPCIPTLPKVKLWKTMQNLRTTTLSFLWSLVLIPTVPQQFGSPTIQDLVNTTIRDLGLTILGIRISFENFVLFRIECLIHSVL